MTGSDAVREKPVLVPTPNDDALPRRYSDFATFCDALDYAAQGTLGFNFHDARGTLARVYPYSELRSDALLAARRMAANGVAAGDRVALIAETGADFAALFCGAIYAGAWPVPLPLPTSFGGKENYIDQLTVQLASSDPKMLVYPGELAEMCGQAAARQGCPGLTWDQFAEAAPSDAPILTRSAISSIPADRPASPTAWR
jgi:fatty-acyl-CoA synthase